MSERPFLHVVTNPDADSIPVSRRLPRFRREEMNIRLMHENSEPEIGLDAIFELQPPIYFGQSSINYAERLQHIYNITLAQMSIATYKECYPHGAICDIFFSGPTGEIERGYLRNCKIHLHLWRQNPAGFTSWGAIVQNLNAMRQEMVPLAHFWQKLQWRVTTKVRIYTPMPDLARDYLRDKCEALKIEFGEDYQLPAPIYTYHQ